MFNPTPTMHIYPEFLALKIVLSRLPYFYIIQHIASGVYYVGYKCLKPDSLTFMTTGGYQTSSRTVKNIIAKEGLNSFRTVKIHHFETKEEAFKYETRFLKKVGVPYNPKFLNQHVANNFGNAGKKLSEEAKAKIRESKLGKKMSEEAKAKMRGSKGSRGSLSKEHKAKIRESNLNRQFSEEHKAKLRGPRVPHSEEHKAKLRCPRSAETKARMRESKLGKKLTEEHKAKIRASRLGKQQKHPFKGAYSKKILYER
jgi:hypothetical protein